jgi:serine O-acetyltransferase
MKDDNLDDFIALLHQTHKREWEATPKTKECVAWLSDLFEFLFPNNHANKLAIYIKANLKRTRST